jgi:hypothetical protein
MPASIARRNTSAFVWPAPRETIAGPGQNPAIPHPAPKMRLPITNGLEISLLLGIWRALPKKPLVCFEAK